MITGKPENSDDQPNQKRIILKKNKNAPDLKEDLNFAESIGKQ